jgi:hypothetical protein
VAKDGATPPRRLFRIYSASRPADCIDRLPGQLAIAGGSLDVPPSTVKRPPQNFRWGWLTTDLPNQNRQGSDIGSSYRSEIF